MGAGADVLVRARTAAGVLRMIIEIPRISRRFQAGD